MRPIEELRNLATRKLPQLIGTIERSILVRRWLEAATRCECPSLDQCDLFAAPQLPRQGRKDKPSDGDSDWWSGAPG